MSELIIKPAMGIGDQCYGNAVANLYAFLGRVKNIKVVTTLPFLYEGLQSVTPIVIDDMRDRDKIDGLDISYVSLKHRQCSSQWQDTLERACIPHYNTYNLKTPTVLKRTYDTSKKVCIVKPPSVINFERKKTNTKTLTPKVDVFNRIIEAYRDRVYFVAIGASDDERVGKMAEVDLDLTGKTTPQELFEAIRGADMVLTQTGNPHVIGEGYGKSVFVILSRAGLDNPFEFYNTITPTKLTCKPNTFCAVDDERDIVTRFGLTMGVL